MSAPGEGKCPVDHSKMQRKPGECPVDHTSMKKPQPKAGECPVDHGQASPVKPRDHARLALQQKEGGGQSAIPEECPYHENNVKKREAAAAAAAVEQEEELNPRNMMPPANQQPAPGQRMPLPTRRQVSSIPKAGEEEKTWEYPSQQMFYNALRRKGKLGNAKEEDMASVVAIHNYTNERAWRELLKWEEMHKEQCANPKLVRFRGKYDELSPKARARTLLGGARPFDRHDWVVDRCGTEVRYIIDYYDAPPDPRDPSQYSIKLDVRPALDSIGSAVDRARMAFRRTFSDV